MSAVTTTSGLRGLMREEAGLLPNSLAISYALLGQLLGLAMLVSGTGWLWVPGVLLVAHSMVIAAYLIHEAAHMTLFRRKSHNQFVGEVMGWLCGAAYASFERIRNMHFRHHRDRADVTRFDYKRWLQAQPNWFKRAVYVAEWSYMPAIELIMHYQLVVRPFTQPDEHDRRLRVVLVGVSRVAFFVFLFWLSPMALLLYALSYWLFLTVLNLNDAFHHTFDQYFVSADDEAVPMTGKDRAYEQAHTYSNVVSVQHPWLNLLALNFGYHNAHHEKVSVPWYRLPETHEALYGSQDQSLMPWSELFRSFHRNRVRRVLDDDYGAVGQGRGRVDNFVGAHGVSFLTVV